VFKAGGSNENTEQAIRELDKYLHHYARYHAHDEAQTFARKQLTKTIKSNGQDFMIAANKLLVECRRVLKYSYCFVFYMKDEALITDTWTNFRVFHAPRHGDGGTNLENDGVARQINTTIKIEEEVALRQKEVFEYHQTMLERFTDTLSEMVEKPEGDIDRNGIINKVKSVEIINKVKSVEIINKTRIVDQYMKNILQYVDDEF